MEYRWLQYQSMSPDEGSGELAPRRQKRTPQGQDKHKEKPTIIRSRPSATLIFSIQSEQTPTREKHLIPSPPSTPRPYPLTYLPPPPAPFRSHLTPFQPHLSPQLAPDPPWPISHLPSPSLPPFSRPSKVQRSSPPARPERAESAHRTYLPPL